ncbi:hypothetical protein QEJ31_05025 [Pigmentibacter sp. JX0631]|uniref:hypothetical protein n=1 Tax=Pigmentibacter sp. JX0631 TaxID=2976982 RepID=UPI0024699292|nr:hypothetical protein [Pigmentibacter sp. JX0631]WGL60959.1 hypothetical protein QEJ31_05025 [Pigmentibacter sp. JX0631]
MSEEKVTKNYFQNQPAAAPIKELGLEEIIQLANKIGLEYVEKRKEAERLELLRTSVRAKIMNRIELTADKIPEARLKRLAEADSEYIELLEKIVTVRAETEKLRIRYESYKSLFDARRTMISYKKVELKTL